MRKQGFLAQKVRLVPRWSATQRLTLTLGMLRSLRRTRIAGIRYSMNVLLVPVCCGQHVLPFPASGSPSAKQRFARAPKGELPRLYNRGLLKIGARDEQRVSANSTYALFARWEMSKRKNKAFAVPERGGTFPLAARDAGSPKLTKFFARHQREKFVNPYPIIMCSGKRVIAGGLLVSENTSTSV